MSKIWIVWKCEEYENYSLVSAHRTRDEAIAAAMAVLKWWGEVPRVTDKGPKDDWSGWCVYGQHVMVTPLAVAPRVRRK